MYDHVEQATMLRQEQVLKARGIQSASVEGGARYVKRSLMFFTYSSHISFSSQMLLQIIFVCLYFCMP